MFLRGVLAVGVLIACVVASVHIVLDSPDKLPRDSVAGQASPKHFSEATLAKAPISLGNPAAAASLRTHLRRLPHAEIVPDTPYSYSVHLRHGETLSGLLIRTGFDPDETHAAISELRTHYNPRQLDRGQRITLTFLPERSGQNVGTLLGFSLDPDPKHILTVHRTSAGDFSSAVRKKKLSERPAFRNGVIHHSLYVAGRKSGVPNGILAELIHTYSWDVDFQRDIRPGDSFKVLYDQYVDKDGTPVSTGDIRYAVLTINGTPLRMYRYTTKKGVTDYFNEKGKSARKALLRTPIDGARISSPFGMRRHPILGYSKMHRGIDFAAPRGTPIYAAGDGVIAKIGWVHGYGHYIRIRHNRTYATAYAHMSRFAKNEHRGTRVKQGQVIGYVGTTGRSTGPHLHYEILKTGRQVNPMKVHMPARRQLAGREFARFKTVKAFVDRQIAALQADTKLASNTRE